MTRVLIATLITMVVVSTVCLSFIAPKIAVAAILLLMAAFVISVVVGLFFELWTWALEE